MSIQGPPRRLLVAAAIAAIALAGCGSSRTATSEPSDGASGTTTPVSTTGSPSGSSATGHSPNTTITTAGRSSSPGEAAATVAAAFAGAYARYLDGLVPAALLPDATTTARAQAGPAIPPADRAGSLVVESVKPLAGGRTFALELRDRAHSYAVQVTAAQAGSHWLIVGLQPPDLDSILHGNSRPIPQPSGSSGAAQAARAFMRGYLPWLYGEGRVSAIRNATVALVRQLRAHPPNIPPSLQGLQPRLAALGMQRHGPGWDALANVTDGRQTYDLTLTVVSDHGRWLVSDVSYPH